MKMIHGIFLPDGDQHFQPFLAASPKIGGKATYQLSKYKAALAYVKERTFAVDVGGHVGLWAMVMARDFTRVWSFEPIQMHRDCFQANTAEFENITLFPYAISNEPGKLYFEVPHDNTGHTQVDPNASIENAHLVQDRADAITLDGMRWPDRITFLKVDVEGFELNVVHGGKRTLLDHKPVVIIEQKPNNAERFGNKQTSAVQFLLALGMKQRQVISGDHILTW